MTRGRISLSNVEVRWSSRSILAVEDMQIRQGEFVGIIGTNGAGKTTLLKVCCGLISLTGMIWLSLTLGAKRIFESTSAIFRKRLTTMRNCLLPCVNWWRWAERALRPYFVR